MPFPRSGDLRISGSARRGKPRLYTSFSASREVVPFPKTLSKADRPTRKNSLKRSERFPHYPNKWKTSRSVAVSHSLGFQPGNSRLESSKVPEPTGKRLRCFVLSLPERGLLRWRRSVRLLRLDRSFHLPSARRPLHSADWTPSQQSYGSDTIVLLLAQARPGKRPRSAIPSATLSATSGFPGQTLAIPVL
jgi:hypothetical protein